MKGRTLIEKYRWIKVNKKHRERERETAQHSNNTTHINKCVSKHRSRPLACSRMCVRHTLQMIYGMEINVHSTFSPEYRGNAGGGMIYFMWMLFYARTVCICCLRSLLFHNFYLMWSACDFRVLCARAWAIAQLLMLIYKSFAAIFNGHFVYGWEEKKKTHYTPSVLIWFPKLETGEQSMRNYWELHGEWWL